MNADERGECRKRRSSLRSPAFICGFTCVCFLGGCLWNPFAEPKPQSQPWKTDGPAEVQDGAGGSGIIPANPADPRPASAGIRVDAFMIAVPRGAVSGNEGFWRRVDETGLPRAKYDALFSNGVRVGVARREDWPYLKKMLDDYPARFNQVGLGLSGEQTFPVTMREDVRQQVLSVFDASGRLRTTTFQNCDDVLNIAVAPAPRRPDAARVALTPMVRERADRLALTEDNRLQRVQPTYMYDLSLAVEVPVGQVLVISPSTDVAINSSIGRNFLLVDEQAEQLELVLLVVPAAKDAPAPTTKAAP